MRRFRRAVLMTSCLLLLAASHASAVKNCGTFVDPDGARIQAGILKGHPTCTRAKATLRSYALAIERDGCTSNACPKTFGIVTCSSATAAAFPRLYTCATSKTRYSAYSTAD